MLGMNVVRHEQLIFVTFGDKSRNEVDPLRVGRHRYLLVQLVMRALFAIEKLLVIGIDLYV